jgi:energy-coupling factor transporter ATP-binding protein EcfA2
MMGNPYPGLRAFRREEADLFFGRDEQIEQLLDKFADLRFISVVGLSGCGKSSLVLAGVIPSLENGLLVNASAKWQVAEMRPGNQPIQNLAEALLRHSAFGLDPASTPEERVQRALPFLTAQLRRSPASLVEVFHETPLPAYTNVLLVVDQFEELFRYNREGGQDESEAFVKLLLSSVRQDEVPIYVITTMRSEFIGECALFYDLPEIMNQGQFLTPRLTRDQQREVIVEPAKLFHGAIEAQLVNTLLNEMSNDPDQLPLLQHCLMRMWLTAQARSQPPTVTPADYEAVGNLRDALSNHADKAFKGKELRDPEKQRVAEVLFRRLSEYRPEQRHIRHPAPLREVAEVADVSVEAVKEVVEAFRRHPDRCFLTPPAGKELKPDTILDVSHESLIRQWKTMADWVEQEEKSAATYRRLEETAFLWQKGKAGLWDTPDLDSALQWQQREKPTPAWATRYGEHFDLAIQFLQASRREKFRMKWVKIVLLLFIITLTLVLSGWALRERAKALNAEFESKLRLFDSYEKQKEAERNSASFKAFVNATFAFLTESGQQREFLYWTQETSTIDQLTPALRLMIDLSESIDESEKQDWNDILSTMNEDYKLELFYILGREAAQKVRNQ